MPARRFDPAATVPFPVSRSKLELFLECRRCFWLDRRAGIARPAGPPFNLNSAVDALLKNEFDRYRAEGRSHPLMDAAGLHAVPHAHPQLAVWRHNFTGVRAVHEASRLELYGAIDDLWRDLASGELIVADYKSTSKAGEVSIEGRWQAAYRRQMEVYQWLLRRQGLRVSPRGWFVYANAHRDRPAFDARLEFAIRMIPYHGDDGWIEPALLAARATLEQPAAPAPAPECAFCAWARRADAAAPAPARAPDPAAVRPARPRRAKPPVLPIGDLFDGDDPAGPGSPAV